WAQAGKFGILQLTVSPCAAPEGWTGPRLEALSFLVSGILIMSGADLLRLAPLGDQEIRQLEASGWGLVHQVWTPYADSYVLLHDLDESGRHTSLVAVDPHQWWTLPNGEKDRATLTYLT